MLVLRLLLLLLLLLRLLRSLLLLLLSSRPKNPNPLIMHAPAPAPPPHPPNPHHGDGQPRVLGALEPKGGDRGAPRARQQDEHGLAARDDVGGAGEELGLGCLPWVVCLGWR